VGFVGCVLLLFFLWVSLFVCLFCFAQGEGQEEKKAGVFWWVVLFSGRMAKASWLVMGFIILFQFIAFGLALGAIARRSKVSFFFHKHIYVSGVFLLQPSCLVATTLAVLPSGFFSFPSHSCGIPK
jgi:hypothetical protein